MWFDAVEQGGRLDPPVVSDIDRVKTIQMDLALREVGEDLEQRLPVRSIPRISKPLTVKGSFSGVFGRG